VLRLLQREAQSLRGGDRGFGPTLFAQHVRNRAFILGISPLQSTAEERLVKYGTPHFRLVWTASRESPALVRTLTAHHDRVAAVAVCPDGRHAFAGAFNGTLRLWDLQTGGLRLTFAGDRRGVRAVAVTPDGRVGLTGSLSGTLELWDLRTGQLLRTLGGNRSAAAPLAISPDGHLILSASSDGTIDLWEVASARLRSTFAGH
jgi:WD40 repeat protein